MRATGGTGTGWLRRAIGVLTSALLVVGASVAMVGAGAAPAGALINDDATFRAAYSNSNTTRIDLDADISCNTGVGFTRNTTNILTIDGHGHSINMAGGLCPGQRVLEQTGTGAITFVDVTISGGSLQSACSVDGGGIKSAGSIVLDHAMVFGNGVESLNVSLPGCEAKGGGVSVAGLTMLFSTVGGNAASCTSCAVAQGAGIVTTSLVAVNSTIAENFATAPAGSTQGGGVLASSDVSLTYATVAGNQAATGANVNTAGSLSSFASVIADPVIGTSCVHTGGTSQGYNWEETDNTCGFNAGTDLASAADPALGVLQNNGGPTLTKLPGVVIQDRIPNGSCIFGAGVTDVSTDQRDLVRPSAALASCDTGAVEAQAPGSFSGTYTPLPPVRILDTRGSIGGLPGAFGPQQTKQLTVTGGSTTVPATGVEAVILNVTAVGPTAAGWLTVFPAGATLPSTANLNFDVNQTVPNLVVVKVGAGGQVSIGNSVGLASAGFVNIIADVVGYYGDQTHDNAVGHYTPITPFRLLDTRTNAGLTGPFGPNQSRNLVVADGPHVPTNASAVVINVTAAASNAPGWLTLYPGDAPLPLAANLNFLAGQAVPNLVVVGLPNGGAGDGSINIANTDVPGPTRPPSGSVHVIGDIVGYFSTAISTIIPMTPQRVLDTRVSGGPIGPNGTITIDPRRASGLPPGRAYKAVIVNVTAIGPTAQGWLTVYPSDAALPLAANVNFLPGQNVPNLVMVGVGPDGKFKITNTDIPGPDRPASGFVHVAVDIVGWYQ